MPSVVLRAAVVEPGRKLRHDYEVSAFGWPNAMLAKSNIMAANDCSACPGYATIQELISQVPRSKTLVDVVCLSVQCTPLPARPEHQSDLKLQVC